MKRIGAMLLVLALLMSLAACQFVPDKPDEGTTTPTVVLQEQQQKPFEATHYDWAEELPRMDGSTSTIPLEAGIRAALFGTSIAEAELQVKHSTTYGSFYNLIGGNCDLIFSVPLSDEQIAEARKRGMELEMTKIAAEGFVFVVNAKNPVDTLTQQQLKDIFSGKITNWKEVGGNDADIVAYQRNETSGSQNFMHTFMGDTPLMKPTTEFLPTSMGALMDAVAVYDNAENAIGYSVYAYAADMYGNGNEIKFIHVDGVEPTKATMAAGDYPLLGYNYAVYNAATPADTPLRKLVEWLTADEGQRALQAAGYIPLRPVGDIAETVVSLYTAVGTGPEKPADYTPSLMQYKVYGLTNGEENTIDGLTNTTLQEEISAFIADAVKELGAAEGVEKIYTTSECVNGYLSVRVSSSKRGDLFDVRTAIYDLVAGKQIAFSDLFFKGEDYVTDINIALQEMFREQDMVKYDSESGSFVFEDRYSMKRPFAGLEAGHDAFTLTEVLYGSNGLYTDHGARTTLRGVYQKSVLSVPRDLTGVFDDTVKVFTELVWEDAYVTHQPVLENICDTELLSESIYPESLWRKANTRIREICDTELSKEAISRRYGREFLGSEGLEAHLDLWAGRWLVMDGGYWYPGFDDLIIPMAYVYHFFDIATGEEVPYTALLKEGWQDAATWYRSTDDEFLMLSYEEREQVEKLDTPPSLTDWTLCSVNYYTVKDGTIEFTFDRGIPELCYLRAVIPMEYFG